MKIKTGYIAGAILACLFAGIAHANNLELSGPWNTSNLTLTDQDMAAETVKIGLDIRWDHSWRLENEPSNRDACWIFVKYRKKDSDNWQHATLSHKNQDHRVPEEADIEVGLTDGVGKGIFIFRSDPGSGTSDFHNVRLSWKYGADKVGHALEVELQVMAIEMVYIPEGSFELGTTIASPTSAYGDIFGSFEGGGNASGEYNNSPFRIESEAGFFLGGSSSGSLGNNNAVNMYTSDDFNDTTRQWLPHEFPKGFDAFYIMKYEITEAQYVDFLNMLTYDQRRVRENTELDEYRHKIRGDYTSGYTTTKPNRTCSFLNWADGAAYADWSGLRPFTELEFEKACRGTKPSVPNEYAWGNMDAFEAIYISENPEDGTETVTAADDEYANANYHGGDFIGGDADGTLQNSLGPLRAGIFAASGDGSREQSGASYYGVMELSGNMLERPISLGNRNGRSFAGTHGDGQLSRWGGANVRTWPGPKAIGVGFRGGHIFRGEPSLRVSDRRYAAHVLEYRRAQYGFRAARTAP